MSGRSLRGTATDCDICQDQYNINTGAEPKVAGRPKSTAGRPPVLFFNLKVSETRLFFPQTTNYLLEYASNSRNHNNIIYVMLRQLNLLFGDGKSFP